MRKRERLPLVITGFLIIGFVFRLYPLNYKNIINPDGVWYINQAKAILDGNFELALSCGYKFISIYHLLIPVFYTFSENWITAAKSVSILFGTLTIIPFYLIARQFFRESTVFLATLAFTINPFLVSHSEDLIKGPIFWFFALYGIFFFISAINQKGKDNFLILSCIFFLIAGWARFEIIIFFIGSVLYIFIFGGEKLKKLFFFCLPLIVLSLTVVTGMLIYNEDFTLWTFYLEPRLVTFFRDLLDSLLNVNILEKSFLAVWSILLRLTRVFYAPLVFLLIAIAVTKKELQRNRNFSYFILLASLSFVAVFLFYLKTETMVDRYVAIIMLPAFIFICTGIEELIRHLKAKGFNDKKAIGTIFLFIVLTVVIFPHNLVHKRKDQLVYEEIGNYIARLEKNNLVKIIAPDARVSLFANLYSGGIECAMNNLEKYNFLVKMNYQNLVLSLKENKIDYYLWEEGQWSDADYNFLAEAKSEHFQGIMNWNTKDRTLALFRIKQ